MSDSPLRFAIVGCGVIGPTHARALAALPGEAALVACCDAVPERAAKFSAEFGCAAVSFEAILADPTIDAVSVCVPSGLHAQFGVAALRAGKHVIVEKPMDISRAACDSFIAAQRETGKKLAVISQHRFDLASILIKATLEKGELGTIVLADARVPWFRTQDYYDSGDWRGTWKLDGGGALMNQGVHTADLLRWLCGPAETVYAQARTGAHERIEVEDAIVATVTFASGAIATLMATTAAYPGFPVRLAVHGTKGSAVMEGDRLHTLAIEGQPTLGGEAANAHALQVASGGTRAANATVSESVSGGASDPAAIWGDAHRLQLADFIRCCHTGETPVVDGMEGRNAVDLVLAVYESARTGQVVRL